MGHFQSYTSHYQVVQLRLVLYSLDAALLCFAISTLCFASTINHFLVKQYKETRYEQSFVMYSAVVFYVMRSFIHLVIQ